MTTVPEEIAVALGRPAPEPDSPLDQQWQMWIDDADRAIRRESRIRNVSYDDLDQDDINYVIREAVVAHIKKPDDATQVDVQVEDGRVSKRFTSATGRITIISDWWSILFPNTGSSASAAFSIRPSYTPDRCWP